MVPSHACPLNGTSCLRRIANGQRNALSKFLRCSSYIVLHACASALFGCVVEPILMLTPAYKRDMLQMSSTDLGVGTAYSDLREDDRACVVLPRVYFFLLSCAATKRSIISS